jgi:hypothetical protein
VLSDGDGNPRQIINSSGNVGIGNIPETWYSTFSALQIGANKSAIYGRSENNQLSLASNSYVNASGNNTYINSSEASLYEQNSGVHKFFTAPSGTAGNSITFTERMRIDSSGNFLYAKTTTDTTTTGVEFRPSGLGYFGRSGGQPIIANRNTNDGTIIELRKDGTTVGNIGTQGGTLEIGSGDVYLQFNGVNDWIKPVDGSGNNKSGVDLGTSGAKFDNLYLGGNIYLGGTGSANALDDYEEGTWTPTYSSETGSFGSITYDTSVQGFYTKIGRMVHLMGFIRTDDVPVGTASSYLYLDGLPFTMLDGYTAVGVISRTGSSDWGGNIPLTLDSFPNASKLYIGYRATSTSNQTLIQVSDMDTGTIANRNALYFSITYQTN